MGYVIMLILNRRNSTKEKLKSHSQGYYTLGKWQTWISMIVTKHLELVLKHEIF